MPRSPRQVKIPDKKSSAGASSISIRKIHPGFILPSAAFVISRKQVKNYAYIERKPVPGDLVYGSIAYIGEHSFLENKEGRLHTIGDGSRAVFVFGNRYAPHYYEGLVPPDIKIDVDLLARSGIVGIMRSKNSNIKDPTKVRIKGYVCDKDGNALNTRDFPLIKPRKSVKKPRRAKLVLVVGTSMNSGKSTAATACCWALSTIGQSVRASKVTGTAGLKDILHMEDAGASPVADFSYLGYPSTYLLPKEDLIKIFNDLDLKYANNPKNHWVVEIADGLLQKETAMLLESEDVRDRIHRLIFCATDAFGAMGGLTILKERFDLEPDAISGICSSSPLSIGEIHQFTGIPVFNSQERDLKQLSGILL